MLSIDSNKNIFGATIDVSFEKNQKAINSKNIISGNSFVNLANSKNNYPAIIIGVLNNNIGIGV